MKRGRKKNTPLDIQANTCLIGTLPKFNSSPLKSYLPNKKVVFQPLFLRGELLNFGGVYILGMFGFTAGGPGCRGERSWERTSEKRKKKCLLVRGETHEETPFDVVYHQFRKHSHCFFLILFAGEVGSLRHEFFWRPKLDVLLLFDGRV